MFGEFRLLVHAAWALHLIFEPKASGKIPQAIKDALFVIAVNATRKFAVVFWQYYDSIKCVSKLNWILTFDNEFHIWYANACCIFYSIWS